MKDNKISISELKEKCCQVAETILDISYQAKTGHIGSALSISDLVATLYFSGLNLTKSNRRDRFILSKGHGAAALYSALFHKGVISKNVLDSFGADVGGLCEHPEITTPGVEMTSGSLGHGIAFGAGMAWGLKMVQSSGLIVHSSKSELSSSKTTNHEPRTTNHIPHVFVLISDGECGEGSVWEAAMFATRMKLDNLTLIMDNNGWQCFGETKKITHLKPIAAKWKAFGFKVKIINGHNISQIIEAYHQVPFAPGKPSIIIANTISGYGVPIIENKLIGHFKVLNAKEYQNAKLSVMEKYK